MQSFLAISILFCAFGVLWLPRIAVSQDSSEFGIGVGTKVGMNCEPSFASLAYGVGVSAAGSQLGAGIDLTVFTEPLRFYSQQEDGYAQSRPRSTRVTIVQLEITGRVALFQSRYEPFILVGAGQEIDVSSNWDTDGKHFQSYSAGPRGYLLSFGVGTEFRTSKNVTVVPRLLINWHLPEEELFIFNSEVFYSSRASENTATIQFLMSLQVGS